MTARNCLERHGIKPNKSVRAKVALEERTAEIVKEAVIKERAKGPSRNDLMLQAKAKGIKNFRILNKEELIEIVGGCVGSPTPDLRAQAIVIDAVKRWRSGFGKRKVTNV